MSVELHLGKMYELYVYAENATGDRSQIPVDA